MSRHQRRADAKRAGVNWHQRRAEEIMERARRETAEARERLARWAAQPGRTQAAIDALNARVNVRD